MKQLTVFFIFSVTIFLLISTTAIADSRSAENLYKQHCAQCHHEQRLGGIGPALLPENLKRLSRKQAAIVIASGRPATQMPAFGDRLNLEEIQSLVKLVYTPLATFPVWGMNEIQKSRIVPNPPNTLPSKPIHDADPMNLFVVVELADHHATILDGDRLEPIHRFETRFALHGGPKFSPDGRFVYFASRDGWITRYDLYNLKVVAEVRAGINTRNLAVSGDGKFVMVANYLPNSLVVLESEQLTPVKIIPVVSEKGENSRISAVFSAPPRNTFVAALKDLPEVWEIPYNDKAHPIYRAMVHDFRLDSGEKPPIDTTPFPVRRIKLDDYLDDFFFDPNYRHLIGAARNGLSGQVVNLDVGRKIAAIDIPGMPHLSSGITWRYKGSTVLATPNLKEGVVTVINLDDWKVIKKIKTLGPGFFMRSHENSPYAWVDVFFGPHKDAVHIIDKKTLEIVKTVRPSPGKTSAHVEFTQDGRYALLSIWDTDGAIIVYDAKSLEEVKRIPMKKPSGKYNVHNKITRSSGTSH